MSVFKFIFIGFGLFLFLRICRVIRYMLSFEKREKPKTFKEGEVVIYKTKSDKENLNIEAETVDFEEIKDSK